MRPWQGASLVLGCLLSLAACGQKGPLQMPTDPKAAQRAGLIDSLLPATANTPPAPASAPTDSQPHGKTPTPSTP